MVKIMSNCLTRGKVAKNILLVLVLFIPILTLLPQNALAEENRQVNASVILDKIEKGALVAEENCTIIGDLDLSKINLSTIKVDGRELRRVNNSFSIKNSIIKGNVNFNDIYFSGPVNFDGTDLTMVANFEKSVFSSSANFKNATFSFDANFMIATFNGFTDFNGVNFTDRANFDYATFNRLSYFNDVCFNDKAEFRNAKFYDDVQFNNASFKSVAAFKRSEFSESKFNNVIFNEDAQFDNAKFKDKVEFKDHTTFYETASFRDATFSGLADFEFAQFGKTANFDNTEFNDEVKFWNATFHDYTSFMDATFNKADFEFAKFNKTANFSNTDFNDEARFQNAIFNDEADFNFAKFKDRAYFTDASFKDKADFSDADIFLTMKINWSQLDGKLVYDGYFYQSLIRNFETLGQSEDANDAYYEYKVAKRRHINIKSLHGLIRRPLERIFLQFFCGYGVKPLRAIRGAGIIIGSFSVVYWWIEVEGRWRRLWASIKDRGKRLREFVFLGKWKSGKNKKLVSDSPLKDRLKRLWEFLKDRGKRALKFVFLSVSIFTTLGKWTNWKPAEKNEKWFHFFAIIEVFLGWIIMVLFVISLTMTWIR